MKRGERITFICKACGKQSEILKSHAVNGRGQYCSRKCANNGMTKGEFVPCEICGKPILRRASTPNKRFCSKACMGIGQRGHARHKKTGAMINCARCGKEFYAQKSRVERSQLCFCSKDCQIHFFLPNRTGAKSPFYKGGIGIYKNSKSGKEYQVVRGNSSRIPLHREIASKVLGRELRPFEIVHHIDGNGLNNANDNLLVCTAAYHTMLHHKMGGGLRGQA